MPPALSPCLPLFLVITFVGTLVSPEVVLESGYYVSTLIDFNKLLPWGGDDGFTVRPFALLPFIRLSNIMLLLDSSHSAFYTIELPLSQDSAVRLLSGKGTAGFSDGDPTSAMFNRPQSFAVDSNDNIYVADRINHAIRKISSRSGMTSTIAGGYSRKAGHTDGSAQNATFSANFDLLYMPKMCALLISDGGNGMIRRMDLKPEDCEEKRQPRLGAIPASIIAVVALLCGLAFGFIARPYVTLKSTTGSIHEPLAPQLTEPFPINYDEASTTDVLLRHQKHFISGQKLQQFSDERKDLIDFEGESDLLDSRSFSADEIVEMKDDSMMNLQEGDDEGKLKGKIDSMMMSNLFNFTSQSKQHYLVKRRNGVLGSSYY